VGINRQVLAVAMGAGIAFSQGFAEVKPPGYEVELKTQIEFREDVYEDDSFPFDTYLKVDIRDLDSRTDFHFYGKLWKDFGYGTDWDVSAYQIYLDVSLPEVKSRLSVGRQFISEGFETWIADAFKLEGELDDRITYTFYIGKPRTFEANDRNGDDFLGGFKLNYKTYFLALEHLRDDGYVKKSALAFGNFNTIGRATSWYTRTELDFHHGEFIGFTAGLNYALGKKVRANSEFEYYDQSYTYDSLKSADSIFTLFSPQGRELRLTQSLYYDLAEGWQLHGSYSAVDIQRRGKDNSHILKLGVVRDRWFEEGLRSHAYLLYENGWMGILRGVEIGFTKWLSSKVTLTGSADIARYDKVTYGKQWANAFYIKGTYQVDDFSNLELGVDYRRNEDFDSDTRLILRYNYLFWGSLPERKKKEAER
jgi:hypothetical protein